MATPRSATPRSTTPRSWSHQDILLSSPIDAARNSRQRVSVIRKGPLFIAFCLLCTVPMFIFGISQQRSTVHDLREELLDRRHDYTDYKSRPRQQDSSSVYKGRTTAFQHHERRVMAETATARCELHSDTTGHNKDWIFVEMSDLVIVAVVDAENQWMLTRRDATVLPVSGLAPAAGSIMQEESPWQAAQRVVAQQLGYQERNNSGSNTGNKNDMLSTKPNADQYGIPDGKVPDATTSWTFLGRYRTVADLSGGFTYCYLLGQAVAISENRKLSNVVKMNANELRQALETGEFADIQGAATMSLALGRIATESSVEAS